MTDEQLEAQIDAARQQLLEATEDTCRHLYAQVMVDLINLRSPARIAQMEIERGLR